MVCTTVTVIPPQMVISGLAATTGTVPGDIIVSWNQDLAGDVLIQLDSLSPVRVSIGVSGQEQVILHNVSTGTHTICVAPA